MHAEESLQKPSRMHGRLVQAAHSMGTGSIHPDSTQKACILGTKCMQNTYRIVHTKAIQIAHRMGAGCKQDGCQLLPASIQDACRATTGSGVERGLGPGWQKKKVEECENRDLKKENGCRCHPMHAV